MLPMGGPARNARMPVAAAEPIRLSKRPGSVTETTRLGTKPFILYVEDEPLLRELVAEVLADNDLPCVPAENGPDAIRIMEDGAYEFRLLLCDVKLPGTIDVFAVADHFEQRYPDGEVVLITAHIARRTCLK